jgi:thioredoxin-related protein
MKHMKKLSIITLFVGFVLGAATATAGSDWLKDYDQAMTKAKEEGKILLVKFHGSDWCPPCIKLDKEVLATSEFKSLADQALVLVDADFPRKFKLAENQQAHNEALARKFEIEAFPTVLIIDGEGKVLDKMVGYPRGGLDGFLKFITEQTGSGS